ncbi:L-ascorbate oxidase homolog, partial [Olea europaea subsp. europaea]
MEASSPMKMTLKLVFLFVALAIAEVEDPYEFFPWNVSYGDIYSLGVRQQGILINGQFLGPDIHSITNNNLISTSSTAWMNNRSPRCCERRPIQTRPKPAASPLHANIGTDAFPSSPLQWLNASSRRENEKTGIESQNWVK